MKESPTKVLDEFIEMLAVMVKTKNKWEQYEVLSMIHSSQAHALNRYIKRLREHLEQEEGEEECQIREV